MTHGWRRRFSRLHKQIFASLLVTCVAGTNASASEIYQFYTGVRQMGMGGAYTGIVNDETAILTNPAGLGQVRDTTLTLIDPEMSGSFNDTNIATVADYSKVLDIQKLLPLVKAKPDTHWNLKGQVFPSIVGTNFGFGLHLKYQYDAEVNTAGTIYRYDYTNDWAMAMGYCLRFFGGIIKIGTSFRLVDRTEVHQNLDATSTTLTLSGVGSEGTGVGADVGLIMTAPIATLPALSVVVRDAGNTAYGLSDGLFNATTTRPADTMQTIDAGISFFPLLSNHDRMTITAEYHDLMTASTETDQMRRVHAGVEFNIHDFLFIRGGLNQRYYTAGIELASESFQLQAATYGEEIGTPTTPKEDRRFVGKFSIRF
jgi:hypothetical protein